MSSNIHYNQDNTSGYTQQYDSHDQQDSISRC